MLSRPFFAVSPKIGTKKRKLYRKTQLFLRQKTETFFLALISSPPQYFSDFMA
jgi:hypothetical protein